MDSRMLLPRIAAILMAVALGACVAEGASPPFGSGDAGSSGLPSTELGTFDISKYQATFDTVLTKQDLTETKRRYTADYQPPLGLEFTIHPDDETKRILETSLRLSVDRTAAEMKVERIWFRVMLAHQPEALTWIREQRDHYLAEPGADVSIRTLYGPVCAGFFAFGAETSPGGKATTMGYFVETQDAHVNCQGKES